MFLTDTKKKIIQKYYQYQRNVVEIKYLNHFNTNLNKIFLLSMMKYCYGILDITFYCVTLIVIVEVLTNKQ